MLNLPIAMKSRYRLVLLCFLALLMLMGSVFPVVGQLGDDLPRLDAPAAGEAVQGAVQINGNTQVAGFRSMEVAFAYQTDGTNTWFLLERSSQPVKDGVIATWDTSTISDGIYRLRLMVTLENGPAVVIIMEGVRVRNYTPVETITPSMGGSRATAQPTATPPMDYQPPASTLSPLPTNPAQVTSADVQKSLRMGSLAAFGAALIVGGYLALRALIRH